MSNSSIETSTGIMFDVLKPEPYKVHSEDIIHCLPRLNRFCGHTSRPISVIEHAVNCCMEGLARACPPEACYLMLHHDDSEVYCADVPRPLKDQLTEYNTIENRIQDAIYESKDITTEKVYHMMLKLIDYDIGYYEAKILMPSKAQAWIDVGGAKGNDIVSCYVKEEMSRYQNRWLYKTFGIVRAVCEYWRVKRATSKYIELDFFMRYKINCKSIYPMPH